MIKIYFDDIVFELQKAGGISKYWSKMIENFSENNELSLINIQGDNARDNVFYPMTSILQIKQDSIFPLQLRRYLPIFNKVKHGIFHSSYYRVPFFFNKNVKQIVTVHDFMYEFFDSGMKKNIHVWQKRKSMKKADAIICVSKHTKLDLLQLYPEINPNIVYVVPNGVDKEFRKLKKQPTILKVNQDTVSCNQYLLYVGNRIGCKNFEFVLRLLFQSKFIKENDFKVVCVGGGKFSKDELSSFKKNDIELSGKILNIQHVTNEELNKLYNSAYALLFPSKYEGFGIPALEAQAAGCPVVYAKTSSLPEVMAYTELAYELDNLKEADQRLQFLKNKVFRNTLIKKGISHASKLSWENSAQLTLEVYKKVLDE